MCVLLSVLKPKTIDATRTSFQLKGYVELVDVTGRVIWEDKRGYINNNLPPILDRLGISPKEWIVLATQFESRFKTLVGCKAKLIKAAKALGLERRPAFSSCEALLQ